MRRSNVKDDQVHISPAASFSPSKLNKKLEFVSLHEVTELELVLTRGLELHRVVEAVCRLCLSPGLRWAASVERFGRGHVPLCQCSVKVTQFHNCSVLCFQFSGGLKHVGTGEIEL